MKLTWRTVLPIGLSVYMSYSTITFASINQTEFASPEHVAIGNNITLYLTPNDPGHMGIPLHLPSGLNLTYGEIVSFGDFYEVLDQQISQGQSEPERRSRFIAAFNSFALNPAVVNEAQQILDVIYSEQKMLDDGMKRGETPEEIYKRIGYENDRQFNCITGGGCQPETWFLEPGRYLNLANQDYDHFGENAWLAYQTGHQLALEQAAVAHQTGDLKKLEMAYAVNAFASHFLTDRFAAGHMRTPRVELTEKVTPGTIGSILANFMHDEENAAGLRVHNLEGDQWITYGDKSYFSEKSGELRRIINLAMQHSADEVFEAFKQGTARIKDDVPLFVPIPDENANTSNIDISPLFYWDVATQQLMRRTDISNLYDRHWTDNWWGWSTLIALQKAKGGLSDQAQAILVLSNLREQALQAGLITNKDFIAYIKKKN